MTIDEQLPIYSKLLNSRNSTHKCKVEFSSRDASWNANPDSSVNEDRNWNSDFIVSLLFVEKLMPYLMGPSEKGTFCENNQPIISISCSMNCNGLLTLPDADSDTDSDSDSKPDGYIILCRACSH